MGGEKYRGLRGRVLYMFICMYVTELLGRGTSISPLATVEIEIEESQVGRGGLNTIVSQVSVRERGRRRQRQTKLIGV